MQEVIVYNNPVSAFLWKPLMSPYFWVVFSIGIATVTAFYQFEKLIRPIKSRPVNILLELVFCLLITFICYLIFKWMLK